LKGLYHLDQAIAEIGRDKHHIPPDILAARLDAAMQALMALRPSETRKLAVN
jgi:hypothetical protein